MSPLWRDRLALAIAPQRIVLVRTHGRLRPQVVAKSLITVPGEHAAGDWQAALDTLAHTLQTDARWQGLAVNAVLSNHFVRYQIIPWSAVIASAEERAAYVRAPQVPFVVVARDDSAARWLAFSAPVEMGQLSYYAWRCTKHGWLIADVAAALAALLGFAALATRRAAGPSQA